jgi:hypothetical protein
MIAQFLDDDKILENGSMKMFSPYGTGKTKWTISDVRTTANISIL